MKRHQDQPADALRGAGPPGGNAADLRRRAEARLQTRERNPQSAIRNPQSMPDTQRLVHELQVHQTELEMQNEELRRAQHELEVSREKYFDFYDLAPVGYLTLNEPGLILEANLTTTRLMGVARTDLLQQPLTRFILREDLDIFYQHRQQLFETRAPQSCELRLRRPGGAPFWVRSEAILAQDHDTAAPVCRVSLSDITKRKQAEETLAQQLEILNATPDFVGLADARDTRILYINPAGRKMIGVDAEEDVTRLKMAEVHSAWTNRLFREQIFPIAIRDGAWKGDGALLHRDGREIPVTMVQLAHKSPGGEVERFSTISRDLTERKQAEAAREGFAHFQQTAQLMKCASDSILLTNEHGRILEANDRALETYGYSLAELRQKTLEDLRTPESRAELPQHAEQLEMDGRAMFEAMHQRRDGVAFPVEISARFLEIAGVRCRMGIVRDITQRKRAEHEVRQRMKELWAFFSLAEITEREGITLDKLHQEFANILPESWQYPEIACARIVIGDSEFRSKNFMESAWNQSAPIKVNKSIVGRIEVGYLEEKQESDEGPFLKEERLLIDALAKRLGSISERQRAEEALRDSETRFRELFSHMSSGVSVYEARNDGQDFVFKDFNRAAERIEATAREAVLGRSVVEVFPGVKEFGLFNVLQRVWRTGQAEHPPMELYRDKHIVGWRENHVYRLPNGEIVAVYDDITERQRAEEALRELSLQLSRAEDAERRRIARELHDSTGQKLAALSMTVGLLQDATTAPGRKTEKMFANCLAMIEQCAQEIRTLSYLLHPPLLDELGLIVAISDYVAGFSKRSGVQVALDAPPGLERLPPEAELALFRVMQESLGNIHRHAGASAVCIHLACDAEQVTLEVSDEGRGMSPETIRAIETVSGAVGVGIAGMRERLRLLGGRLEIKSGKCGTTVRAIIPRPQEPA